MTYTPPPAGWYPFGTHVDVPTRLEFSGEDDGGMPKWEWPAASESLSDRETVALLRAAARTVREAAEPVAGAPHSWPVQIADLSDPLVRSHAMLWQPGVALWAATWLDAEAALLGELEPVVDLFNAVISRDSDRTATISLGRTPDGTIAMRCVSTPAAVMFARAVLGPDGSTQALASA